VRVTNYYDKTLQFITGCTTEPAIVSENLSFIEYLYFIFTSYPEIEMNYPPGYLGFTINGKRPGDFTILSEGDAINFFVVMHSRLID